MLPQAASEYDRNQDAILRTASRSVGSIWRRMFERRNWQRAWEQGIGPDVQTVVLAAQEASAAEANAYVAAVLAELDFDPTPVGAINLDAFIGVAGDGRPVDSLTYGAVVHAAKAQYTPELEDLSPSQKTTRALLSGQEWMDGVVATILADTARAVERTATAQRPHVGGYVRMVSPGACSRCIVLAGKFYRSNTGFLRHPKCQCRHIPASENVAGDLLTSPDRYFESLSKAEQDRVFTEAGAEAIRLGADVGQVVNSRRGMQLAQVYRRKTLVTTEGATARGLAGKSLGNLAKTAGQRYRVSQTPRLMPETILAHAKDPQDALRLLKRFGYVL